MEPAHTFEPETDLNLAIKKELVANIHEDYNIPIKNEEEEEDSSNDAFKNVQLHIKEEVTGANDNDESESLPAMKIHKHEEVETETILPITNDELKEEMEEESDLTSYDYPTFEDSMDSSEAAALSQVEACLNDDIKAERYLYEEKHINNLPKIIKEESELTVTETHLISNKLIDTPSTHIVSEDGLLETQTTKTLIMEIHPISQSDALNKLNNPEEILPTTNENYNSDYGDDFQLNSITSNILSLEQEAYGLLETKKTKLNIGEMKFFCCKCPKTFRFKSGYKRHLKIHETIERREMGIIKGRKTRKENQTKLLKELEDNDSESLEQDSKQDIELINKDGYVCTCGQVFQRRSRMETCLRSHTLFSDSFPYSCATCDKKFKSKSDLIYHRNKQHRRKFPCKFCPTDYDTQKALFKHLQIHQKVQLMEYKIISEVAKGKQELHCLICSKTYNNLTDLKSHTLDDHKDPYTCPYCNHQIFNRIIDFIDHMKKTHPDNGSLMVMNVLEAFSKLVKAWRCDECGQQFHEADKLALHQLDDHTPEMKSEQHFQCEDCQRVFISNQGLNSHRRMHHPKEITEKIEPEEVGVMCLECRKICKDMNALTSHMRLHSMDRKYPCKFCDFRFATPQKRKVHAEIHTGDMKYVCFICEYQCSSENRLKQHKMSLKHLNMKEYLLTGKPLVEEETKAKKKKVKDTSEDKRRKKERRDRVSESSEVACDICGEKFSSDTEMQDHKQTHPFIEFPNEDKPTRIFFK